MRELLKEVEALNNSTPNGVIIDADTILADITEKHVGEGGMQYTGIAQCVFDIWKGSSDPSDIEDLFELFTGVNFGAYLQTCKDRITK